MSSNIKHEITADVVRAARENPNGWVYKIEEKYGPTASVPPEGIVGAWKVDANGNITGEFIPNPKWGSRGVSAAKKP